MIPHRVKELINSWRTQWYLGAAIEALPPLRVATDNLAAEVHMMVSRRHLHRALAALHTFFHYSDLAAQVGVMLHLDGTVGPRLQRWFTDRVPGVAFTDYPSQDARLDAVWQGRPFCRRNYEKGLSCMPKLFHVGTMARADRVIVMDSDVAFFATPSAIVEWVRAGDATPRYMVGAPADRDPSERVRNGFAEIADALGSAATLHVPHYYFNSGLLLLEPRRLSFDLAERYFAWQASASLANVPGLFWFSDWTLEQTAYLLNFATWHESAALEPPEYVCGSTPASICNHYMSGNYCRKSVLLHIRSHLEHRQAGVNRCSAPASEDYPNTSRAPRPTTAPQRQDPPPEKEASVTLSSTPSVDLTADWLHREILAQESLIANSVLRREPTVHLPVVHAVVITHNSARWIEGCIGGLVAQDSLVAEIVIVDNASTDATLSLVHSLDHSTPTTVLAQDANLGYAAACNLGIRYAMRRSAAYVLILNPDVELRPKALAEMVDVLACEPNLGPVSPLHVSRDATLVERTCLWFLQRSPEFPSKPMQGQSYSRRYATEFVIGAVLLLSRRLLDEVGLFDETFFFYGEDHDLCRRSRLMGHPPAVSIRSQAYHWHASGREMNAFRRSNMRRSNYQLRLKVPDHWFGRNCMSAFIQFARDLARQAKTPREMLAVVNDFGVSLRKSPALWRSRQQDIRRIRGCS